MLAILFAVLLLLFLLPLLRRVLMLAILFAVLLLRVIGVQTHRSQLLAVLLVGVRLVRHQAHRPQRGRRRLLLIVGREPRQRLQRRRGRQCAQPGRSCFLLARCVARQPEVCTQVRPLLLLLLDFLRDDAFLLLLLPWSQRLQCRRGRHRTQSGGGCFLPARRIVWQPEVCTQVRPLLLLPLDFLRDDAFLLLLRLPVRRWRWRRRRRWR